jgi:hypothetical protein
MLDAMQVLTSPQSWAVASRSPTLQAAGIIATSAGTHSLKGIAASIELLVCTAIQPLEKEGVSL